MSSTPSPFTITITITMLLSNIKPHQQVQSAPSQSFPPLANPALSLENWTAITTMNLNLVMTAAENVLRTSHASVTTQPLVLDSGRCHHHLLALHTVVAAKVPQVRIIFVLEIDIFLTFALNHRCRHLAKLSRLLS